MSFTVLLHPKAAKELEKIESATKTGIVERVRNLKDNPERVGKALKHSNFWSLRVGDYRAIYEIDMAKRQVIVLFVGHRKKSMTFFQNCSRLLLGKRKKNGRIGKPIDLRVY